MNWALWASFAAISAVNIVTPGPANLNTVRRAMQLGMYHVAPTIYGNALGLALGGAICAAGITSFVMSSDLLWSFFQWVGVAYLAWRQTVDQKRSPVSALPNRRSDFSSRSVF